MASCRGMLLAMVMVITTTTTVKAACNIDNGPAGSNDCFTSHHYNGQGQWGTCVSEKYLILKSKGRYRCRNHLATFCYFQCMLEFYDQDSGNVTSDCACDPDNPVTSAPSNDTMLPPRCFSPDGTNCSWYRDCLEAKYQCASKEDDYGLKYGETFCQLYSHHSQSNQLSQQTWEWVNNVRKCLMVELVPLVRDFESKTSCLDIKTRAFQSHVGCYVKPFNNVSSVCDLSLREYWKVFWTIRANFHADFVESVLQLLEVRNDCARRYVRKVDEEMRKLLVTVNIKGLKRTKRSASRSPFDFDSEADKNREQLTGILPEDKTRELAARRVPDSVPGDLSAEVIVDFEPNLEVKSWESSNGRFRRQIQPGKQEGTISSQDLFYHQTAADVSDDFARQLHWEEKNVLWFTYGIYLGQDQLEVHMLLADKNITITNTNDNSANLTAVLEETTTAFEQGKIVVDVDGDRIDPGVLSTCEDLDCQEKSQNITAPPLSTSRSSSLLTTWSVGWLVLVLVIMSLLREDF